MAQAPSNPPRGSADPDGDPIMAHYLSRLDLSDVDPHILADLDGMHEASPAQGLTWRTWFVGLVFVALGGAMLWLPTTALYQLHGAGEGLFWLAALLEVPLGLSLLRSLTAESYAPPGPKLAKKTRQTASDAPWLSPQAQRGLLTAAVFISGAIVVFVLPREAEWQGQGYSGGWFLGAILAVTTGILVGRVIMMQAQKAPSAARPVGPPIVLPHWFRWLSLSLIVGSGAAVGYGPLWQNGGDPNQSEFIRSLLGLVVGFGAAVWLARRFDDLEHKWQKSPPPTRRGD